MQLREAAPRRAPFGVGVARAGSFVLNREDRGQLRELVYPTKNTIPK